MIKNVTLLLLLILCYSINGLRSEDIRMRNFNITKVRIGFKQALECAFHAAKLIVLIEANILYNAHIQISQQNF